MNDNLKPDQRDPLAAARAAARQEQFLEIVSLEEARARFEAALPKGSLGAQSVPLAQALGRVLARDIAAPVDAPPFDRSGVDGIAVRAEDTAGASAAQPVRLMLNAEVLACGTPPCLTVAPGTATVIATGGVVPRGADAVVMVEQITPVETPEGPAVEIRRPAAPGQFVTYAGSDVARGETVLRAGTVIDARALGILAVCGLAEVSVVRRPVVAVLSTGDELVPPGQPLGRAQVYDSNGAIVAATVRENGGEPLALGAVADDEDMLEAALRGALEAADLVVLSGGTSKGAGDVSHRVVTRLGAPGVLVHGVALKPGKPLCLAAVGEKGVVVLPGFPTSAIFTFQSAVVPALRRLAGLPQQAEHQVSATVPLRLPSERGRTEFVMAALAEGEGGLTATPIGKGSGAVTTFSQADGFFAIDALSDALPAGTVVPVTLIGGALQLPDIVFTGSHCLGLDAVISRLRQRGFSARTIAVGSLGGLQAAKRGACDIAAAHLFDPATGTYNVPFLAPGLSLLPGWRRLQGVVFRKDDPRFAGRTAREAVAGLAQDAGVVMVNRNAGSGTRALVDELLGGTRPAGYANQPKSHNAVAAAVAQGRADWGVAIETVAHAYGLGFLPLTEEHYDLVLVDSRRDRPAVRALEEIMAEPETAEALVALGMRPAPRETS